MARFKNHLLVVVGFAVAGMIGAAFGTGTAQAVVSTLVTIVNTAANPVSTQHVVADNPATRAVWLSCTGGSGAQCQLADSTGNLYTVPSGERLVIESFSGFSYVPVGGQLTVEYQTFQGGVGYEFFPPVMLQRNIGAVEDFYGWGLSAKLFVDSGATIICFDVSNPSPNSFYCAAYGHLEAIQ